MKVKPLPRKIRPVGQPFDAEGLAKRIRMLSRKGVGPLSMSIIPLKDGGFQANVKVDSDGKMFAVDIGRNPLEALDRALASKIRVLRLSE